MSSSFVPIPLGLNKVNFWFIKNYILFRDDKKNVYLNVSPPPPFDKSHWDGYELKGRDQRGGGGGRNPPPPAGTRYDNPLFAQDTDCIIKGQNIELNYF